MLASQFTAKASGRIVPVLDGHLAFVPDPLPPQIDLATLALPMSEAMQALGELRGACRRLPNPYILVQPLQRQEALTSSAMEGTYTTTDNLLLAEAGVGRGGDESTREVVNYLTALREALSLLETLPISHRVVRHAHSVLLSELSAQRGAQKRPGDYRAEQNWIGGRTIDTARYVPPPPAEAARCMDELERYINRSGSNFPTPLMDMALVHYQMEAIHPFLDGNGRVGRMLISLMAVHSGLLDTPVLYLSPVLERHKDEYIDLMFNVSTRGEWTNWLLFFFSKVAESCHETTDTIDRLLNLQIDLRERVGRGSRTGSPAVLVDYLFENPTLTITAAAKRLNVSYATAKSTVDRLVEHGILVEFRGTYPKVYYAMPIVSASLPRARASSPAVQPDFFSDG